MIRGVLWAGVVTVSRPARESVVGLYGWMGRRDGKVGSVLGCLLRWFAS